MNGFPQTRPQTDFSGPRLLVSVGSPAEVLEAVHGGADIIDFKDPARGALGMVSPMLFESLVEACESAAVARNRSIPLSAALGEVTDWRSGQPAVTLNEAIQFAKLGMSGLAAFTDWDQQWLRVRQSFDARRRHALQWVAVAYADAAAAHSPPLPEVIRAAAATHCAGVLVDTWAKSRGSLLDHLTLEELTCAAAQCHHAGLFLALAGRLATSHVPTLRAIEPDVIGIRSAACRRGDRQSRVDRQCVAEFLAALSGARAIAPPDRPVVRAE